MHKPYQAVSLLPRGLGMRLTIYSQTQYQLRVYAMQLSGVATLAIHKLVFILYMAHNGHSDTVARKFCKSLQISIKVNFRDANFVITLNLCDSMLPRPFFSKCAVKSNFVNKIS